MALKIDYVARETGKNLARNFTITLASIMTVAVSLTLVGFSLMVSKGVANATQRWEGDIEFIVFMKPDASPEQIKALGNELDTNPLVSTSTYVDKPHAYEEFRKMFEDSPEMLETVDDPEILPTSYRVAPIDKSADAVTQLSDTYRNKPGVMRVVSAQETIRLVQELSERLTSRLIIIASSLLFAAGLLILNTIRMAMYARRREIEVMKLVGATNWFIRVPFMIEGLVQGIIGAVASVLALLFLVRPFLAQLVPSSHDVPLLSGFDLTGSEMVGTCTLIGGIGVIIGAIGAGIAVTRFLDV